MRQIQYITDSSGNKTAVVIPFTQWEDMTQQYCKLQNKLNVLLCIQAGIKEIRQAKRKGEKLQSLEDFLHESNS
jgi:hypothetical protein